MGFIERFFRGEIISYDKMLHFLVGFVIATFLSITNIVVNIVILIIISFGKEWYDLKVRKTEFDVYDALATLAGGIIAIIFLYWGVFLGE